MISKKCGHSFEENAIRDWLKKTQKCPECNTALQESDLIQNFSLMKAIESFKKLNPQIKFKNSKSYENRSNASPIILKWSDFNPEKLLNGKQFVIPNYNEYIVKNKVKKGAKKGARLIGLYEEGSNKNLMSSCQKTITVNNASPGDWGTLYNYFNEHGWWKKNNIAKIQYSHVIFDDGTIGKFEMIFDGVPSWSPPEHAYIYYEPIEGILFEGPN